MRLWCSAPRLGAALLPASSPLPAAAAPSLLRASAVVVIDPRARCRTALGDRYRQTQQLKRAVWKAQSVQRVNDGREVQRRLTFSTDVAVTAAVMNRLCSELGFEEPTPSSARSPQPPQPPSPSASEPFSHTGQGVGRFFRHSLKERRRRLLQAERQLPSREDAASVHVLDVDVPDFLRHTLHQLEHTPFNVHHSPHFLAPLVPCPFSFSRPGLVVHPTSEREAARIHLRCSWRAVRAAGPLNRLETDGVEEQRRAAAAVQQRPRTAEQGRVGDGAKMQAGEETEAEELLQPNVDVLVCLEVRKDASVAMPGEPAVAMSMRQLCEALNDRLLQFHDGYFGRWQQQRLLDGEKAAAVAASAE